MIENQSREHPLWPLWCVVAAVGAHIVEEYALNFVGWANIAMHAPITWEDFHLVNFGVIVYCIACAVVGQRSPAFALSSAALVILNAVGFHGGASVMTGAYSPGTASALILFVPSGLAAYAAASRAGLLSAQTWIVSAGIGLLWHAFLAGVFAIKYFAPLYR
jgi:hypothetical protein